MVEMCDLIPCRKEFLHMASSPQAIQHHHLGRGGEGGCSGHLNKFHMHGNYSYLNWSDILVEVTIYHRHQLGQNWHPDQYNGYDIL